MSKIDNTYKWWLKEFCGKWEEPQTSAKSICSFDLFFLCKVAKWRSDNYKNNKITELGCGVTTVELCRLGFDVECFSVDISGPAKDAGFNPKFNKCDVMDPEWLDRIQKSVSESQLLVIDALHTEEFAKYYAENIFPYAQGPIWIHDYWNTSRSPIPYGEQRYLDKHVIGNTHDIWTMTDLPLEELKEVSEEVGFDLTRQKHDMWPHNIGPRLCSVLLIQTEEYMKKNEANYS